MGCRASVFEIFCVKNDAREAKMGRWASVFVSFDEKSDAKGIEMGCWASVFEILRALVVGRAFFFILFLFF